MASNAPNAPVNDDEVSSLGQRWYVLIIMMLVRPQGLLGIHEVWEMFNRRRRKAEVSGSDVSPAEVGP